MRFDSTANAATSCGRCCPQVAFDLPMMPQGGVEVWLGEVERRMRSSVRQSIVESMAAYATRWGWGGCRLVITPAQALWHRLAHRRAPHSPSTSSPCCRPRSTWVREWPAMVVLAVSQIFWSQGVEAAICEGTLPDFLER